VGRGGLAALARLATAVAREQLPDVLLDPGLALALLGLGLGFGVPGCHDRSSLHRHAVNRLGMKMPVDGLVVRGDRQRGDDDRSLRA
jgi:hypothetical protein